MRLMNLQTRLIGDEEEDYTLYNNWHTLFCIPGGGVLKWLLSSLRFHSLLSDSIHPSRVLEFTNLSFFSRMHRANSSL